MKILCLADLHISSRKNCKQKIRWIKGLVNEHSPDVIVIVGDVFESGFYLRYNPLPSAPVPRQKLSRFYHC